MIRQHSFINNPAMYGCYVWRTLNNDLFICDVSYVIIEAILTTVQFIDYLLLIVK